MFHGITWIIIVNLVVTFGYVRLNIILDKKRSEDLSNVKIESGVNLSFGGGQNLIA